MISESRCRGCFGIKESRHTKYPACMVKCKDCRYNGENKFRCETCRYGKNKFNSRNICNFRWKGPSNIKHTE